jgi:DNA polymerase-3 subunit epsilon
MGVTLAKLEVLIVDCQSTGASPAHGAVLEIGWGVSAADREPIAALETHWVALPEGTHISTPIRELTGFDERAVTTAIDPREAWQRLRAASGTRERIPTAIHYARFELAFLRDWAERFEPAQPFPLDAICVHAIACRIFPDLPRRSIRALAGFLGHGVTQTRQSLAHVEATAFIWRKLVAELAARGVSSWEELGAWLARPAGVPPRAKKRSYPLPSARYRALPNEPGVYRLLRSNGDVLYVGKAASLKKRVASHFSSKFSRNERALEMLTQVHDVRVTSTTSALEAALLENEEIKSLAPPYNVQLVVTDPRIWFANSSLTTLTSTPDAEQRRGPLPSTHAVRALGAVRLLLSGQPAGVPLRAAAMGTRERWAPDEATFAAGMAVFCARHDLEVVASGNVARAVTRLARTLLASDEAELEASDETEASDSQEATAAPDSWDPERVARHLERALTHGYRLLQRARWLCLLHDSAVLFREPGSTTTRVIEVSNGRLAEAREISAAEAVSGPLSWRGLRERQANFDRKQYDRLRTLSSELKRILRDGGSVAVAVKGRHCLEGPRLHAIFRWI